MEYDKLLNYLERKTADTHELQAASAIIGLRQRVAEQLETIKDLNSGIGGEDSTTTENLVRVARLEQRVVELEKDRSALMKSIHDQVDRYDELTAERDTAWKEAGEHVEAQQRTITLLQDQRDALKQKRDELLKALEGMVEIARLTIGWSCTPDNADGPLAVAERLIASVKEKENDSD